MLPFPDGFVDIGVENGCPRILKGFCHDEVANSLFDIQDEVWFRVMMDQIAAQFGACGLNHESSILINYCRETLYAADLERTDITNRETAAASLLLQNQSRNSSIAYVKHE